FGKIIDAGVRVWFYLTREELRLDTDEHEIMNSLRSFGSTSERSKAVARSRDAALLRARAGRNFGGRCYGYDNVWRLPDGTEQPGTSEGFKPPVAQTIFRITPAEAEVVRAMFRMYADGYGAKVIAYCVNGDPAQRD